METTFIISNVKPENMYKGSYKRIFDILNKERIFSEVYESDDSVGMIGNDYHLTISETPDVHEIEQILKLKNVTIK